MNKKEYIEPVMKPVLLKHRSHFMAGSLGQPVTTSLSNLEEDDPNDEIKIGKWDNSFGKWEGR